MHPHIFYVYYNIIILGLNKHGEVDFTGDLKDLAVIFDLKVEYECGFPSSSVPPLVISLIES